MKKKIGWVVFKYSKNMSQGNKGQAATDNHRPQ